MSDNLVNISRVLYRVYGLSVLISFLPPLFVALGITFGGLVLALALAFGLGGRTIAAELLARRLRRDAPRSRTSDSSLTRRSFDLFPTVVVRLGK